MPSEYPEGIDLEIVDRRDLSKFPRDGVLVPNCVRINGTEVLVPEGSEISIGPVSDTSFVTATVTMFVRNLTIRTEPKD